MKVQQNGKPTVRGATVGGPDLESLMAVTRSCMRCIHFFLMGSDLAANTCVVLLPGRLTHHANVY